MVPTRLSLRRWLLAMLAGLLATASLSGCGAVTQTDSDNAFKIKAIVVSVGSRSAGNKQTQRYIKIRQVETDAAESRGNGITWFVSEDHWEIVDGYKTQSYVHSGEVYRDGTKVLFDELKPDQAIVAWGNVRKSATWGGMNHELKAVYDRVDILPG